MPEPKWKKFSDEEIKQFVLESKSYSELLPKLGYSVSTFARETIRNILKEKNIDTSHFLGQGWKKKGLQEPQSALSLKNKLLQERGCKCEKCQNSLWLNEPIPLQLHHIDGNHQNNNLNNLIILCPNCHALTNNWKGKNHKGIKISDQDFLYALKTTPNINQACLKVGMTPCQSAYARARRLLNQN